MLRFFHRRRGLDDFIDGVRPELAALATPEPTDGLKRRILASRAAGMRMILPDVPPHPRVPVRLAVALAVGAALVALLVPLQLRRASAGSDVASPGVFGQVAFAEVPRGGGRPALPPVRPVAPATLRAVSLEFERRVTDRAGRVAANRIDVQVAPVSLAPGARDAWRVVHVDRDAPLPTGPRVSVETVYVARADMRLLRRAIHVAPYSRYHRINVWQEFHGDSVTGRMNTEGPSIGAGRTFARRLPGGVAPVLTESVASVFFSAVPLRAGWSGAASLIGWAVRDDDVLLPIELRVEGAETVTVPAGRFDCWHLSLRFSGRRIELWTRRSDGIGVRMLDTTTTRVHETREIVLTRMAP